MRKIVCGLAVALMIYSGAFGGEIGPSSIMNFNDSVTHDEAGNEWTAHGDPVLSSTQSVSGGKSLFLDGDSYLQAKDTKPFDFSGEFTLEAWIYPREWVTDHWGGATFTVFSRWLHGTRTLYLMNIDRTDDENGILTFYTNNSSLKGKTHIPLNTWTHIAVTRDSEKVVRLFVNGKLEGEKRFTQDFTSTDFPMTIGASSNALRKSIGYIDDWHVYKVCLYRGDFEPSGHAGSVESLGSESVYSGNGAGISGEGVCRCRCGYSAADEIRKFKALLDEGIITREEFDAVKKKLLGL